MSVPLYVVGFQLKVWINIEDHESDAFARMLVSCAQTITANEKDTDAGINVKYSDDNFLQGSSEIVSCFRHWTADRILYQIKIQNDFETEIDSNFIFYFDLRYQKNPLNHKHWN